MPERGREKNVKKMKGEGYVLLTKRVKLHWGVIFVRGDQVYTNVTESKQPNTAVSYV